jgi:hypothetical protein
MIPAPPWKYDISLLRAGAIAVAFRSTTSTACLDSTSAANSALASANRPAAGSFVSAANTIWSCQLWPNPAS